MIIMYSPSASRSKEEPGRYKDRYQHAQIYETVIRVIIESSLIAWVGLLAYAIASTYFLAHNELRLDNEAVYKVRSMLPECRSC
jgi:hypothetical protein